MADTYVIVGGVAAGATAAARLRRLDEHARIIVIERGPYVSFANCGLPYFISGDISKRSKLLLQSVEGFWSRYRVEVRANTEAVAIDRAAKKILLKDSQQQLWLDYDQLILAQGGSPFVPELPGIDAKHVFTLWTVPDMDAIHRYINTAKPVHAVVVGGGFIGLEMAEALHARGLVSTVLEQAPNIMMQADPEISSAAQASLETHGIKIMTNKSLQAIQESKVLLKDGSSIPADLVLVSIGVRPELTLAKQAGLEIGSRGGLVVDEYLRTSDPNIWAAGDMVEIVHKVLGTKVRVPLAGPANRQGRIVASNASGKKIAYNGALGTSVLKLLDHTLASTGLSEAQARQAGMDVAAVTVHKDHHASYYPGASKLTLKLVFGLSDGKILGAQAFGTEGVEKRIDVVAMALQGQLSLDDLAEVDLAYAPPYSSANDPLNIAAFSANNRIEGYSPSWSVQEFVSTYEANKDLLLDVRGLAEWERGHMALATHIPLDELRDKLATLDKSARLVVYCDSGYRSHLAVRMLMQEGFKQVINISGGLTSLTYAGCKLAQ